MKTVTLLLKVTAKSVSPYALMDSSMFRCGLSLQLMMGQQQVGCANRLQTFMPIDTSPSLMANLYPYH